MKTNIGEKLIHLCLLMIGLLILPVSAQAQFTYTTNDDDTLNIAGYTGSGGNVTIPDKISGLPVTTIGDSAFYENTNLTSVTFGTNVTTIGDFAFAYINTLTNISLGTNITDIGESAFPGSLLTSLSIPDSVTNIGENAFGICFDLTAITIPSNVISLGDGVFEDCPSLIAITVATNNPVYTSVAGVLFTKDLSTLVQCPGSVTSYVIPSNATSIGSDAFNGCNLNNLVIPNTVTNLGIGAFDGCYNLTSITLPNTLTYLADDLFNGCENLTNITIPSSVTTIGFATFQFCEKLTNFTIPNGVLYVGDEAFSYCENLTNLTIPSTVTNIGDSPGEGSTSLISFTVDPNNPAYCDVAGVLFDKNITTLIDFPGGLTGSYTIPNGARDIGEDAFFSDSISNVIIPNTVTSIEPFAFGYCMQLNNVIIPASVETIAGYAFENCSNLTNIDFAGNAPSLTGTDVFDGDTNAMACYLPGTSGWSATFGGIPAAVWATPPPPPAISITVVGGQPVVIYPLSIINYTLQMTTNLTSGSWMAVSNGVPFIGMQITNAPANAFFRLH